MLRRWADFSAPLAPPFRRRHFLSVSHSHWAARFASMHHEPGFGLAAFQVGSYRPSIISACGHGARLNGQVWDAVHRLIYGKTANRNWVLSVFRLEAELDRKTGVGSSGGKTVEDDDPG